MSWQRAALAVAALLLLGACSASTSKDAAKLDATKIPDTITVTSPDFANNAAIPRDDTCAGPGNRPALAWRGVPVGTQSIAVVVDDPDAPKGDFVHWVVIGLTPQTTGLDGIPAGAHELDNTGGTRGWTPPCPPPGSVHHYHFTVYALRTYVCASVSDTAPTPDCSPPSTQEALPQIQDAAIAKGALVGTYRR